MQKIQIPRKSETGELTPGRPPGKTELFSTEQALGARRRLISTPAPISANATLLGSGTVSIWNVSTRRVGPPEAGVSEYSPKAVTLPPGRSDSKVLPSTRAELGVKLKESQALAAVVQLKVTFCAPAAKPPIDETATALASVALEAYQLPPISTAMRYPGAPAAFPA